MSEAVPGRAGAWQAGPYVVALRCPQCGGAVEVPTAASGVRCRHCGTAHLVAGRPEPVALVVPDRVGTAEEARRVVVDDLRRRRAVEQALEHAALAGNGGDGVSPVAKAGDAVVEAAAAAWATQLEAETALLGHHVVLAPYIHLSGRAWQGVVGRLGDGRKATRVSVRRLELSCPAFEAGLGLPEMGALSFVRELQPLPPGGLGAALALPAVAVGERLDELRARAVLAAGDTELEPLARRTVLWSVQRCLVLRPFHLVDLEMRGRRRTLLLDGAGRACWGEVSGAAAARLVRAARTGAGGLPGGELVLRPMRCPVCAGDVPLQRAEEVRFCRTCGRAFAASGGALCMLRFTVEAAPRPGTTVLPFWRLPFALQDPRDGARIASLAGLRGRLAGHATGDGGAPPDAWGFVDVPAFRFLERRWPLEALRPLLARVAGSEVRETEGPVPGGLGMRRPARLVAISAQEAVAVGRLALLLELGERDLAAASPERVRQLLFDAPLELGPPHLVLRALPRLQGRVRGVTA